MPIDFTGLEVRVELNGVEYTGDLDSDLSINRANLDAEFIDQAKKYAWWAILSELARDKMTTTKIKLERLYAVLDSKVRQGHLGAGATDPKSGKVVTPVKLTEKVVEGIVRTNQEYQELENAYILAKKEYNLLAKGMAAFEQRKDMLISLGANARVEAGASPLMKTQESITRAAHKAREQAEQQQARRQAAEAYKASQAASTKTRKRQPMKSK